MKDSELLEKSRVMLEKMLSLLSIEAETKLSIEVGDEDRKVVKIDISGDDLGQLIGYRGNNLNDLQSIYAQMLSNNLEEIVTVLIDINQYRQRRERYLQSLAQRASREAKENKQNVELPPLSPYERRIIHLALQDDPDVTTESLGEGEDRHIVVKVK